MIERIELSSPAQPQHYSIFVGASLLERLSSQVDLKNFSQIVVLSDQGVWHLWQEKLLKGLGRPANYIEVPAGEAAKNFEVLAKVWEKLLKLNCDRETLIIGLGGGAIGDLTGFAASTFMRGLSFILVPTTLLAQVDSSVGGKNGINISGTKNIVGTISSPLAVISDTDTLTTLNRREYQAGFAEVIKHALIADAEMIEQLFVRDIPIVEIVTHSVRLKAKIVTADLRESGPRRLLNFGHTLGHAIEALSIETAAPLLHGEAVALGMLGEAWISMSKGLLTEQQLDQVKKLLQKYSLPTSLSSKIDSADIKAKIALDKKRSKGEVAWTLLNSLGQGLINQSVSEQEVSAAIEFLRN